MCQHGINLFDEMFFGIKMQNETTFPIQEMFGNVNILMGEGMFACTKLELNKCLNGFL